MIDSFISFVRSLRRSLCQAFFRLAFFFRYLFMVSFVLFLFICFVSCFVIYLVISLFLYSVISWVRSLFHYCCVDASVSSVMLHSSCICFLMSFVRSVCIA